MATTVQINSQDVVSSDDLPDIDEKVSGLNTADLEGKSDVAERSLRSLLRREDIDLDTIGSGAADELYLLGAYLWLRTAFLSASQNPDAEEGFASKADAYQDLVEEERMNWFDPVRLTLDEDAGEEPDSHKIRTITVS